MNAIRSTFVRWLDRHIPLQAGELSALDLLDRPVVVEQRERVAA